MVFNGLVTDYVLGLAAPDGIYIPDSNYRFSKKKGDDILDLHYKF